MKKLRFDHLKMKSLVTVNEYYTYSSTLNESKIKKNYPKLYRSSKISLDYFFRKLLKDIKLVLISFFKLYIKKYNEKKEILIQNLLEKRNTSAKIIQENYITYLLRKDLFSLAKKHKYYYSIYPSFINENNNQQNFNIKIYTDLTNSKKYTILPLRFCLIRNCYVFDIPKNKFPDYKKIMRFNFVSEKDDRIIDPNYKKVIFGGKYVNEIDFKKLAKNPSFIKKHNKIRKSSSSSILSDSDSEENKKYNTVVIRNMKTEIKNKDNFYNGALAGLLPLKYKKNKNENDLTNSTMSTKGSPRINNDRQRKGSILKETHSYTRAKNRKKVSFGFVKFSY